MNWYELEGKTFNGLTVLKQVEKPAHVKWEARYFLCKCQYCGKEKIIARSNIGKQKSCGCQQHTSQARKHGFATHMKRNRLYHIWQGIKFRCNNPKSKDYKNYGGRGIQMCEEWPNDFMVFRSWALENGYEEHLTIDRIDVNGNYEPSNCKWSTVAEQNRNKRTTKGNKRNGNTLSACERN